MLFRQFESDTPYSMVDGYFIRCSGRELHCTTYNVDERPKERGKKQNQKENKKGKENKKNKKKQEKEKRKERQNSTETVTSDRYDDPQFV